jgi:hypothetical protein
MFNSRRAVRSGTAGMNASAVTKSSRYGEHMNVDCIPSGVSHHTDPLTHQKLDATAAGRSHGYRVPWVSKYCRSPGTRETPLQISPKSIAGSLYLLPYTSLLRRAPAPNYLTNENWPTLRAGSCELAVQRMANDSLSSASGSFARMGFP